MEDNADNSIDIDSGSTLNVSLDDVLLLGAMTTFTTDAAKTEKRLEVTTRRNSFNLGTEYDRSAYLVAPNTSSNKPNLSLERMHEINNAMDFFADRYLSEDAGLSAPDKTAGQVAYKIHSAFKQAEAGRSDAAIETFKEVLRLRSLHLRDPEFQKPKAITALEFIRDIVIQGQDGTPESALQATHMVHSKSRTVGLKEREFQVILQSAQEIRQKNQSERRVYPAAKTTPKDDATHVWINPEARSDHFAPPKLSPELEAKAGAVEQVVKEYTKDQATGKRPVIPSQDEGRVHFNLFAKEEPKDNNKDLFARDVPDEALGDAIKWELEP